MLLLLYGCAYQGQVSPAVTVFPEENGVLESGTLQTEEAARDEGAESPDTDAKSSRSSLRETEMLAVFVCGSVVTPGVYELPTGSRVYEAIALAGGMTDEAAQTAVNQAELLTDGQMIEIPTKEEQQVRTAAEEARLDGLVNINTADLEELKTLPGIGDSKARSIIAYREKNGAFKTIEDIKSVDGIGDGIFAKLEGCMKVD
ncbi:MAG: helix-hairpin-helix domain-containing protein [Lachnospiraceae bacterium]